MYTIASDCQVEVVTDAAGSKTNKKYNKITHER